MYLLNDYQCPFYENDKQDIFRMMKTWKHWKKWTNAEWIPDEFWQKYTPCALMEMTTEWKKKEREMQSR